MAKSSKSQAQRTRGKDTAWPVTLRTGPGRPTTCTPALTRSVALLVATGCSIPVACEAVGLSYKTAEVWLAKGREGLDPYADFVSAMDEAKAAFEALAVRGISAAGRSDWKALAWLLERRFGARWRPPSQRQELTGANGDAISVDITSMPMDELIARLRSKPDGGSGG